MAFLSSDSAIILRPATYIILAIYFVHVRYTNFEFENGAADHIDSSRAEENHQEDFLFRTGSQLMGVSYSFSEDV